MPSNTRPINCLVLFDEFKAYMNVSIESKRLRLVADAGKLDIQLFEGIL